MFPFGVTIPATVLQGSKIPEGLMNNPVLFPAVPNTTESFLLLTDDIHSYHHILSLTLTKTEMVDSFLYGSLYICALIETIFSKN
jgi:hypothetical protein